MFGLKSKSLFGLKSKSLFGQGLSCALHTYHGWSYLPHCLIIYIWHLNFPKIIKFQFLWKLKKFKRERLLNSWFFHYRKSIFALHKVLKKIFLWLRQARSWGLFHKLFCALWQNFTLQKDSQKWCIGCQQFGLMCKPVNKIEPCLNRHLYGWNGVANLSCKITKCLTDLT